MRAPLGFTATTVRGTTVRGTTVRATTVRAATIAGAVCAAIAALAGVAGCGAPDPARASAGRPASTAPSAVYAAVDNLCDTADLTALTEVYPAPVRPAHTAAGGAATRLTCRVGLAPAGPGGAADSAVQLHLEANLFDRGSTRARTLYEGLRGADGAARTAVADLGSGAYSTATGSGGLHIAAWDGNLYLTVRLDPADPGAVLAADTLTRLAAVCRATMARLRDNGNG